MDYGRSALHECFEKPGTQGPCTEWVDRWTFVDGQCIKFRYGGCDGTRNNFKSYKECMNICTKKNACYEKPKDKGPCVGTESRWSWVDTNCNMFLYGGCGGSKNNFRTYNDCYDICREQDTVWLGVGK